jgi:hypothetical protein
MYDYKFQKKYFATNESFNRNLTIIFSLHDQT